MQIPHTANNAKCQSSGMDYFWSSLVLFSFTPIFVKRLPTLRPRSYRGIVAVSSQPHGYSEEVLVAWDNMEAVCLSSYGLAWWPRWTSKPKDAFRLWTPVISSSYLQMWDLVKEITPIEIAAELNAKWSSRFVECTMCQILVCHETTGGALISLLVIVMESEHSFGSAMTSHTFNPYLQ